MAVTAALSISNPAVISGSPSNFVLALANGSATAVSLSSVQFVASPIASAVSWGNPSLGLAPTLTGSATTYFAFSGVFQDTQAQIPGAPSGQHTVSALCSFSDGTACISPALSVVVSNSIYNTPPGSSAVSGQVRFDNGLNSGELVLVSPP